MPDDTLDLELLKVGAQRHISRERLVSGIQQPEVQVREELEGIIVGIHGHVLATERVRASETIEHIEPATGWEHLKADLLDWGNRRYFEPRRGTGWAARWARWWVRRHPPRYRSQVTTVSFRSLDSFPEARIVYPPELGRPVLKEHLGVRTEEGYGYG
jgi:hypothetical protein